MSDSTGASRSQPSAPPIPTHAELFLAFFKITLSGFGGTLPWTRRMFVEEKRWMTAEEFNDVYALCQFLPGPNIVNLTAVFGSRMRGATGALAAWSGFLVLPFALMVTVGVLYAQYRRHGCAAPHPDRHRGRRGGPDDRHRGENGGADVQGRLGPAPFVVLAVAACDRRDALAAALGDGCAGAGQHRPGLVGAAMKADGDILLVLAVQFAIMSLLALGGANAVVPEMHRQAVELRGWMTERAVRRHVRHFAGRAGAERDDGDADRLSRRRDLGRGRHNSRDVRPDRGAGRIFWAAPGTASGMRPGASWSRPVWCRFRSDWSAPAPSC